MANILTNLCTSDLSRDIKNKAEIDAFFQGKGITQINHLCTGASPSPILSYLVNQAMFDEMKCLCDANGIAMTIYVDDTIFSSNNEISTNIRSKILDIVAKYGYKVSIKKVKYYSVYEVKKITGVVIRSDGALDIPNRLRFKIKSRLKSHKESCEVDDLNKLAGCVVAARQIDRRAYPSVVEYIAKERALKKT